MTSLATILDQKFNFFDKKLKSRFKELKEFVKKVKSGNHCEDNLYTIKIRGLERKYHGCPCNHTYIKLLKELNEILFKRLLGHWSNMNSGVRMEFFGSQKEERKRKMVKMIYFPFDILTNILEFLGINNSHILIKLKHICKAFYEAIPWQIIIFRALSYVNATPKIVDRSGDQMSERYYRNFFIKKCACSSLVPHLIKTIFDSHNILYKYIKKGNRKYVLKDFKRESRGARICVHNDIIEGPSASIYPQRGFDYKKRSYYSKSVGIFRFIEVTNVDKNTMEFLLDNHTLFINDVTGFRLIKKKD